MAQARVPRWALVLTGWLCGVALLEVRDARATPPAVPVACTLEEDPPPPRPPSTREWRAVAGIGGRRALALARARWEHGPDFDPERVHGIGPVTAGRARELLRERAELRERAAAPPAPGLPPAPLGRTPPAGGVHSPPSRP